MNTQIKAKLDQLYARLNGPLTVKQAKEEYWTLRQCVTIQQDNAVLHACTKAKSAVDDAVLKAEVRERMEKNFAPFAQKKQLERNMKTTETFVKNEQLRQSLEAEKKLKNQIESLQSTLSSKEDQEEALKQQLETSEKDVKCMAKIAARVSIENARLYEEIEKLKKKYQLDAVKLEKCRNDADELARSLSIANIDALPLMADQVDEDSEEMDLLDKLDMEGFRGIH